MEMSTNITELRRLQSQLTSLGLIVGSVSHGIKGLLSGLSGGIYLMDTGFKKEKMDRVKQGWDMVQRNVDRIRSMVLNILYYAKDREVFWQPLDMEELASSIGDVLTHRASVSGVDLHVDVEPGTFEGDPNSIHSMLVNLMENSIDACRIDESKMSHHVTLTGGFDEESVVFEITDNGIGMDQETKEKVFSLFFSSKGSEGTGLGLFISHKIVKSHGGEIEVDSVPGAGTRFRVTLPRTEPSDDRTSRSVTPAGEV
jgi:signal transduction histidine kinase